MQKDSNINKNKTSSKSPPRKERCRSKPSLNVIKGHNILRIWTAHQGNLLFCDDCHVWIGIPDTPKTAHIKFRDGSLSDEAKGYFMDITNKAKEIRDIFEAAYPDVKLGQKFRKYPIEWFLKNFDFEIALQAMHDALSETNNPDDTKEIFKSIYFKHMDQL